MEECKETWVVRIDTDLRFVPEYERFAKEISEFGAYGYNVYIRAFYLTPKPGVTVSDVEKLSWVRSVQVMSMPLNPIMRVVRDDVDIDSDSDASAHARASDDDE